MQNIRMLFCHIQTAPFAHKRIGHMGIYFPRNLITTAKHVVQVALSKFGLPCAFLGKSDLYSFS